MENVKIWKTQMRHFWWFSNTVYESKRVMDDGPPKALSHWLPKDSSRAACHVSLMTKNADHHWGKSKNPFEPVFSKKAIFGPFLLIASRPEKKALKDVTRIFSENSQKAHKIKVPQGLKITKKCRIWFSILAFSANFCPMKIDLSGNTVWLQASAFQKLAKIGYFWHF